MSFRKAFQHHSPFTHERRRDREEMKASVCLVVMMLPLILSPACREVDEELEVVWQAATRDKHSFQESLLDSKLLSRSPHGYGALSTSAESPDLQTRTSLKCDSQRCSSLDEMKKNGMDFYC